MRQLNNRELVFKMMISNDIELKDIQGRKVHAIRLVKESTFTVGQQLLMETMYKDHHGGEQWCLNYALDKNIEYLLNYLLAATANGK